MYYPTYLLDPQNFYIPSGPDSNLSYHQQGGKRVKIEAPPYQPLNLNLNASSGPSTTTTPLYGATIPQHHHQVQLRAPHINFHQTSEPASPVTVATTLSQQSTPSRSPSRVSILSTTENSAPDWVLFGEDPMSTTLVNDLQAKDRFNSFPQHHQPSHPHSQLQSYPLHMDQTYPPNCYSGYTIGDLDIAKFSEQQYLSPYTSNYSGVSHNSTEEDLPALSPPSHYASSGIATTSEGARCSPMTPMGSPQSHGLDGASSESAHVSIFDDSLEENLQFLIDLHNATPKLEDDLIFNNPHIMTPPKTHSLSKNSMPGVAPSLATFYQKAQSDHAQEAKRSSASSQFAVTRDRSPFRTNSPFHPRRTTQDTQPAPVRHSNFLPGLVMTARSQREQQHQYDTQNQIMAEANDIASTPKTISPKDAVLEYPEPEDEASKLSLFSNENNNSFGQGNGQYQINSYSGGSSYNNSDMGEDGSERSYKSMDTGRRASQAESLTSSGAFSYQNSPQMSMAQHSFPPYIQSYRTSEMSMPSNIAGELQQSKSVSPAMKPHSVRADTGTYTCTSPGCKQRFPTSAKLHKHRRESHRQSTPIGSTGMTSALHGPLSRHQGPHKCTRTNPTTGKPCNTIFSRPYDLTRHEDTIHNTSREKVRCEICNDEKTFSRQDALTRHKKVSYHSPQITHFSIVLTGIFTQVKHGIDK